MTGKRATIRMRVTLPDEIVAPLRKRAEAMGKTVEQVIAETLEWYYGEFREGRPAAASDCDSGG